MKKNLLFLLLSLAALSLQAQQQTFEFFKWNAIPHNLVGAAGESPYTDLKDMSGKTWGWVPRASDNKLRLQNGTDTVTIAPSAKEKAGKSYQYYLDEIDELDNKWIRAYGYGSGGTSLYDYYVIKYSSTGAVSYFHPAQLANSDTLSYWSWSEVSAVNNQLLVATDTKFLWKTTSTEAISYASLGIGGRVTLIHDKVATIYCLASSSTGGSSLITFHADGTYQRRLSGSYILKHIYNPATKVLTVYTKDGIYEVTGKTEKKLSVPSYEKISNSSLIALYSPKNKTHKLNVILTSSGFSVQEGNAYTTLLFAEEGRLGLSTLTFSSYYVHKHLNLQNDSTLVLCFSENQGNSDPGHHLFTYKKGLAKYYGRVNVPSGTKVDAYNIAFYVGKEHSYFYSFTPYDASIVQIKDNAVVTQIPSTGSSCYVYVKSSDMRADGDFLWIQNEAAYDTTNPCGVARLRHDDYFLRGAVYYDANKNGYKEATEFSYANVKVVANPSGLVLIPDSEGKFAFKGELGKSYTLTLMDTAKYAWIKVTGYDIGIKLKEEKPEMQYSFFLPRARCQTSPPATFWLQNKGVIPIEKVVVRLTAKKMQLLQNELPVDTASFTFANLQVKQNVQAEYQIEFPAIEQLGQSVTLYTSTELYVAGQLVSIKKDSVQSVLRCSYDPNDKNVTPVGLGEKHYTLKNSLFQYQIRFENTGNDTAYHVMVADTLDPQLDPSTFQVIGTSHKMNAEINPQGVVAFHFNSIMLPDTGTNRESAQGFVRFAVQPRTSVPNNTLLCNRAAIYFDKNPAVITNSTCNLLVDKLPDVITGIEEDVVQSRDCLYPNPANDWVTLPASSKECRLYNILGHEVLYTQGTRMALTGLEEGVYLAKVVSERGLVKAYKLSIVR